MKIHSDYSDFIEALQKNKVDFVMVGAFDLAFLGRYKDLADIEALDSI